MKVIKKAPGSRPEIIDIEDSDEAIWDEIGGYINAMPVATDLMILTDEDARLKGKKENPVLGEVFYGTILIVGSDRGAFRDVPDLDGALWHLLHTVRYGRMDRPHNVWGCRRCGHIAQFEADSPYENGWEYCPHCGGTILRPDYPESGE